MKQPEQSYTAIETADGFLFFTHTAEGQANMQKFLQLVADHYFCLLYTSPSPRDA